MGPRILLRARYGSPQARATAVAGRPVRDPSRLLPLARLRREIIVRSLYAARALLSKPGGSGGRRLEMLIAPGLQRGVGVLHQVGRRAAEHHLHVRGLEADVLEAVDHARRR